MDSAPAGATRMGSRSSTRHGGPAQVFVGPVRKWRKVWSPVSSSSPSSSAARGVLYKWNPLTPSTGGTGVKEDPTPEETTTVDSKPVKYIPIQVLIQKEETAKKAAEEEEAQAILGSENKEQKETATDMAIDTKQDESTPAKEKIGFCCWTARATLGMPSKQMAMCQHFIFIVVCCSNSCSLSEW